MDFANFSISLSRPIMSYTKVQHLYNKFIRNKKFQLKKLIMRIKLI